MHGSQPNFEEQEKETGIIGEEDGKPGAELNDGGEAEHEARGKSETLSSSSGGGGKFPWLNLSGFERLTIAARLSQRRRRRFGAGNAGGSAGSLVLSPEKVAYI